MNTTTFIKSRKHLKQIIEKPTDQTAYLLSTAANATHLHKSIRSIKADKLLAKKLR